MQIITEQEYRRAKRRLKPIKRKTIHGNMVELKVDNIPNIARVLEVSRGGVYLIKKRYEK